MQAKRAHPGTLRIGWLTPLALALPATPAWAQTDEIQVYDASIAAPGTFNLTWHNNYTVSSSRAAEFPGAVPAAHTLNGVPEWSLGVNRWFELGLYLPLYSLESDGSFVINGAKLRTLFVVPDATSRTFFYGVNFEFSYNRPQWDAHRFSSEIRPIVGWHAGALTLIVNPILDSSFNGARNLDLAPAARLSLTLSSLCTIAAEEYADLGPVRQLDPVHRQAHVLFGVIDLTGKRLAAEVGLGAGLTSASDHALVKLILSWDLN